MGIDDITINVLLQLGHAGEGVEMGAGSRQGQLGAASIGPRR